jgi:CDP-paratose synthetase
VSLHKKVLLTGATGFLGSHLARTLIREGSQIVVLKRKSSSLARLETLLGRMKTYDLEGSSYEQIVQAEAPLEAVFHAATNYGRRGESSDKIFETNFHFPMSLLRVAAKAGVKTFFNVDTILPRTLNDYTKSKYQFLEEGRMFAAENGLRFVNIKMEHIYGPGDESSKFVDFVVEQCLRNVPEIKLTLGIQKREFVFIDDAVEAVQKIMHHAATSTEKFLQFELASDEPVPTIRELVELIVKITGTSTKPLFGAVPYRPQEEMERQAHPEALRALGWRKRVDLETGLRQVITSLKNRIENKEMRS